MQKKKGIRLKKRRVIFLTVVLFLIAFLLTTLRIVNLLNSLQSDEVVSESFVEARDMEPVNFLMTGIDSRGEGKILLDQLLLASYNPSAQNTFLLYIPGETQVQLKDYGIEKVRNIYSLESSSQRHRLLVEMVSGLLNVPVHYFMEIDYRGLDQAVNSVRGVNIDVKETLIHNHRMVFPRGEYLVEEDEAYRYFTFYLEEENPLERLERQRLFMAALTDKVMAKNYITGLPGTINRMSSLVSTNMSWRELLRYYELFKDLSYSEGVTAEIIPGREEVMEDITYWVIDVEEARNLLGEFSTGEELVSEKGVTVEILNGKGEGGIANRLARALRGLGYDVAKVANADHFNYTTTLIISRTEDLNDAAQNLTNLIPGSELQHEITEEYPAQITIIIGHNFDEKELTDRLQ